MASFLTVQAHSLVNEDKSAYVIILPANPIPAERYAANELAEYIAKASGAQLPRAWRPPKPLQEFQPFYCDTTQNTEAKNGALILAQQKS